MLLRGSDTVLGDAASPYELFVTDDTEALPLAEVTSKVRAGWHPWADCTCIASASQPEGCLCLAPMQRLQFSCLPMQPARLHMHPLAAVLSALHLI